MVKIRAILGILVWLTAVDGVPQRAQQDPQQTVPQSDPRLGASQPNQRTGTSPSDPSQQNRQPTGPSSNTSSQNASANPAPDLVTDETAIFDDEETEDAPVEDPANDSRCLPLTESRYCGDGWGDHYVYIPANIDTSEKEALFPDNEEEQTIEMFDQRVAAYVWDQTPNKYDRVYKCPIVTRGYFVGYMCTALLWSSAPCNSNLPGVPENHSHRPLCKESCLRGVQILSDSFQDEDVCKQDEDMVDRRQVFLQHSEENCNDDRAFADVENCVTAEEAEPYTCGKNYLVDICGDGCGEAAYCEDAALALQEEPDTDPDEEAAPEEQSPSGIAPALILVIVIVVLFLILVLVVAYRCIVTAKKGDKKPKNNAASSISPEMPRTIGAPTNAKRPFDAADAKPAMRSADVAKPYLPKSSDVSPLPFSSKPKERTGQTKTVTIRTPPAASPLSPSPVLPPMLKNVPADELPVRDSQADSITPIAAEFTASTAQQQTKRISGELSASASRLSSLKDQKDILSADISRSTAADMSTATGPNATELSRLSAAVQYTAARTYTPCMPDEMELLPGDIVTVSQKYDDGWAYGLNLSTGQLGVFPMGFVEPSSPQDIATISTRHSVFSDAERLQNLRASIAQSATSQSPGGPMKAIANMSVETLTRESSAPRQKDFNSSMAGTEDGSGSIAALVGVLDMIGDEKTQAQARELAANQGTMSRDEAAQKAKELAESAAAALAANADDSKKGMSEEERFSFSALMDVLNYGDGKRDTPESKGQPTPRPGASQPNAKSSPQKVDAILDGNQEGPSEYVAGSPSEFTTTERMPSEFTTTERRLSEFISNDRAPPMPNRDTERFQSYVMKSTFAFEAEDQSRELRAAVDMAANTQPNGSNSSGGVASSAGGSADLDELDQMLREEERKMQEALSSLQQVQKNSPAKANMATGL